MNRNDYLKRFGKSIKREDFETDAEWEAHLLEVQKVYDAMSVREKWEDAYRQVQERNKIKEDEHEMDDEKPMKKGKTATGKKPDEIEMNPDMEDEIKFKMFKMLDDFDYRKKLIEKQHKKEIKNY